MIFMMFIYFIQLNIVSCSARVDGCWLDGRSITCHFTPWGVYYIFTITSRRICLALCSLVSNVFKLIPIPDVLSRSLSSKSMYSVLLPFYLNVGVLLEHLCKTISIFSSEEKTQKRIYYGGVAIILSICIIRYVKFRYVKNNVIRKIHYDLGY